MTTTQEIPFEFFKDGVKPLSMDMDLKDSEDIYVSYCIECKCPMTVKTLVNHSKMNPKHDVKSIGEMKKYLESSLNSKIDVLKKNLQKIEGYKVAQVDENHLNGLKQQGLTKLAETRDILIEAINHYFNKVEKNWIELFEENFFMNRQKEKVAKELNILAKIHLKAKQTFDGTSNVNVTKFYDLKEGLSTDFMVADSSFINRKCNGFLKKLENLTHVKTYPELQVNKLMINNLYDSLKHLFDFNFDFSIEKLSSSHNFSLKVPDFYKARTDNVKSTYISKQMNTVEHPNKYLPVLAKNRRLMVFDLITSQFKELLLSEIHSIPQGNQIAISPVNLYEFYIVGGHFFKKPSNKLFRLNTGTSEFKPLAVLNHPRWMHRVVFYRNFLYAIGGTDNDKELPLASVERYNVDENIWEDLPKLNNARHSHTAVLYQPSDKLAKSDKRLPTIFVFGGIGVDRRYQTSIERFDIERNSWAVIYFDNSFEFGSINSFGCQINDNEIILFGGSKYLEDMTGPRKEGRSEFITYPFNNPHVYIFNVDEEYVTCNDSFSLPYGVNFACSQPLFEKKKLFFMGNLNSKSSYQNVNVAEFTEEVNTEKLVGAVTREDIQVLDHVLFN